MRPHRLLRIRPYILPLLVLPVRPAIKHLHRKPTPEPRLQHRFRNLHNGQIPTIKRHRPQTRTPSPPRSQPLLIGFRIQWRWRFVRIGDLQYIDLLLRYRLPQCLQTTPKLFLQRCLTAFPLLNQPRGRGWIRPFSPRGLEGVEAETDVVAIDFLDNRPDVFPVRGVGGPAPVLVGEAEFVGGEEIAELL